VIDNRADSPLESRASMKIATAPVNWNNADAPDFREAHLTVSVPGITLLRPISLPIT
jgi:hypothetical protein